MPITHFVFIGADVETEDRLSNAGTCSTSLAVLGVLTLIFSFLAGGVSGILVMYFLRYRSKQQKQIEVEVETSTPVYEYISNIDSMRHIATKKNQSYTKSKTAPELPTPRAY